MRVSLVFAILFLLAVTTMAKKRPSIRERIEDKVTELNTCREGRKALRKSLGKPEDAAEDLEDRKAMGEYLEEMTDEAPANAVEKRRVSLRESFSMFRNIQSLTPSMKLANVIRRIKICKDVISRMTRQKKQKDKQASEQ